jgi:hypothetical protein
MVPTVRLASGGFDAAAGTGGGFNKAGGDGDALVEGEGVLAWEGVEARWGRTGPAVGEILARGICAVKKAVGDGRWAVYVPGMSGIMEISLTRWDCGVVVGGSVDVDLGGCGGCGSPPGVKIAAGLFVEASSKAVRRRDGVGFLDRS